MRGPPIVARLLYMGLMAGVILLAALAQWLVPGDVAFVHGGWPDVKALPIVERVFVDPPLWLHRDSVSCFAVKLCSIVIMGLAMTAGAYMAQRVWRFFVVTRWHWMTDEEVEAFWKRDP